MTNTNKTTEYYTRTLFQPEGENSKTDKVAYRKLLLVS